MAGKSTALTLRVESGSPYQLNSEQVLKASSALIKQIKSTSNTDPAPKLLTGGDDPAPKRNLLAGGDDEEDQDEDSTPIWLSLTTKKHIIDQKRLKPAKITVPHPLNTSSNTTICLITCEPQRAYKDIIASPAFPSALGTRITRVVSIKKLKAKWSQYEAQRKLYSEHDIFLADDRIITLLAKALGKTFYKSSAKRPIPVTIGAPAPRTDGKKIARAKKSEKADASSSPGEPNAIAAEIEKAIQSALVHLSPSTNTAVKVGYSSWPAEKLAANVEVVANGLIEKFVPKKWKGVRALHIKGPETAALPIWLADEMWVDEEDVVEEGTVVAANTGKKRKVKAIEDVVEDGAKKETKRQKVVESNDDNLDKEIKRRKEKLRKQKADAANHLEDDVPKATKKSKKPKVKAEATKVGV